MLMETSVNMRKIPTFQPSSPVLGIRFHIYKNVKVNEYMLQGYLLQLFPGASNIWMVE